MRGRYVSVVGKYNSSCADNFFITDFAEFYMVSLAIFTVRENYGVVIAIKGSFDGGSIVSDAVAGGAKGGLDVGGTSGMGVDGS